MAISHEFREYGFEGSAPDPKGRDLVISLTSIREFIRRPILPPEDREESILDNDQLIKASQPSNPIKQLLRKFKLVF